MKPSLILGLAALPLFLTACATPKPPQAYHNTDNSALVIESLDGQTSQLIQPVASATANNDLVINEARTLSSHQTAVVILENYDEPQLGSQFRNRGTTWFVSLRELGYQRIVFLQGRGITNPEGLVTLVEYD